MERQNQRRRTRSAILAATQQRMLSGERVTASEVADLALVSEPTLYRYFPELALLLHEAEQRLWPSRAEMIDALATQVDVASRVGRATQLFGQRVLTYEGAARALLGAAAGSTLRAEPLPARRELLDLALGAAASGGRRARRFADLRTALDVVVTGDALFVLIDQRGLGRPAAVRALADTARTLTSSVLTEPKRR